MGDIVTASLGARAEHHRDPEAAYKKFASTYQDRLLKAILDVQSCADVVQCIPMPTVGFIFKIKGVNDLILPAGVPDKTTYLFHQENLFTVESFAS